MRRPEQGRLRRTKIVCTIGPASESDEMVERLIRAGMDCARLNFSHGDLDRHAKVISAVRKASARLERQTAIMQDLPGPKIRVGRLKKELDLREGSVVTLVGEGEGEGDVIPIGYRGLGRYVSPGSSIYLADGTIRLKVLKAGEEGISCRCVTGGHLLSGKGVNVPRLKQGFRAFTEQDERFLEFGMENGVDLVAVSFVRSHLDVMQVRDFTRKKGRDPVIVAKIEKKEAVDDLKSIVRVSDMVMVARGDLGVENPVEKIPMMQKAIISDCNAEGVPVITATQILESMVKNPTPTRAEVTDIANAILDGTDALMLSEETAVGAFPVECVEVLHRVSVTTEERMVGRQPAPAASEDVKDSLSEAAYMLSRSVGAGFLLSLTNSLTMATRLSKFRPRIPIIAFTQDERQSRKLNVVWGVYPTVVDGGDGITELMARCIRNLRSQWPVGKGEKLVMVCDDVRLSGQSGELLFAVELKGAGSVPRPRRSRSSPSGR
ncbi:MAG: pyruvate kinase [Nitrososphaerota archaeon]|nr:pyruvate kinase [Nitrososphaerota archaeon]